MKISIDSKAGAAYIYLKKGSVHKTLEISSDLLVDLDKKGNALGIEILNLEEVAPALAHKMTKKKSKKAAA